MGWSVGYDEHWNRDIGYGVPSICDHPDCSEEIHRGLAHVCGSEPKGGERGCGLYFCGEHLYWNEDIVNICERCRKGREPFDPKPDTEEWIHHKMTHPSWDEWRKGQGISRDSDGE